MTHDTTLPRSGNFEDPEDACSNPSDNPTMGDIIAERLSRRDLAKGLLAVSAMTAILPQQAVSAPQPATEHPGTTPSFRFPELQAGFDETHHVAAGYRADVLIRWGDKVLPDAPAFDPHHQSASAQAKQFGYNNDFVGYVPLKVNRLGWEVPPSDHGLLVVNHEYIDDDLMFPVSSPKTRPLVDIEMAAHGGSVLEVKKEGGKWGIEQGSPYARRITAMTEISISGPAKGHAKMKTKADPAGSKVFGMVNNCAGGITPWGTWLTCEENFDDYFIDPSSSLAGHPNETAFRRYGVPGSSNDWGNFYDRFDIGKEPNEANRFGWVVEIDPLDPSSKPVKRTALGRFKHEGAECIIGADGRVVIYSGDDERFDYVYKFVTEGRVDRFNRANNRDLLDKGTLYVAKFGADGTGIWIPLVYGIGPLKPANGFHNQGDVVINARLAADLLGATKMDRPEDVQANPRTNRVYVVLTNNNRRGTTDNPPVDAANPRAKNLYGHIIEIIPHQGHHAAITFKWEILVKCGNPFDPAAGASFNPATTVDGWFGMPDNIAVDAKGRLWIATDGQSESSTGRADGLWAIETGGPARGTAKHFFRVPTDAELCGPCFTPDLETLFLSVQHPGEDSTFDAPTTRWPDFKPGMPPRPAVVAITKKGGGKIAV
ncbi:MAG: PhoX family phosphatase [Beijerinckiaceae bacterium]|nr:PhoX family phosphatase [Beijerinckiaceae bacterium]